MNEEQKLAEILVNYSCSLKKGEKIMIEATDVPDSFVELIVQEVFKVGGYPFVYRHSQQIKRVLIENTADEYAILQRKHLLPVMEDMDAYIAVRGTYNHFELSDVSAEKYNKHMQLFLKPIIERRVNHTKWVILNYPTSAFAQQAGQSTSAFRKFFFDVCTFDYQKMDKAMDALKELMEKTDKVRIVGKDTDLIFSIKGMNAIKCSGKHNIPDGEVFTAPVKDSVNGKILYNIPTLYNGKRFDNVYFEIENGKIVKATALTNTEELNSILDSDEGARYFGEFSFGINPYITKPILDILFDEKMAGSFHFTPGQCYEEAYNGNTSAVHWDLVCCQTPEYGGGEIYLDGVLVRKDGRFVLDSLKPLNFED